MTAPATPRVAPPTPLPLGSQMAVLATIPDPPATIAALVQGTIIEGTVIGMRHGLITLKTRYGALTIVTSANPPLGSHIVLEVRVAGDRLQVVILNVEPPPGAATPPPSSPAAATPDPAVVLARGSIVTATVAQAAAMETAATPSAESAARTIPPIVAAADPEIGLRILEIVTPSAAGPPASVPARSASTADPPVPVPAAAASVQPASLAAAPAPIPAPPASAPDPTVFTGTVIGKTPAGQPVIALPSGTLILRVAADLPIGTVLVMAPREPPSTPSPLPSAGLEAIHQALFEVTRGWPALAEAIALVKQTAPADDARLRPHVPEIGPRLAAGLVAAIARLSGPDAEAWLMPILRPALARAGRSELAARLEPEWRQRLQLAAEPPGDGWRSFFLPLLHDAGLRQIGLHLRFHPNDRGDAGTPEPGTRFVIDLDLHRFGALQLDGFVRWPHLDLVLRSHADLPAWVQNDIAAIYEAARASTPFKGRITFQAVTSFPVTPLEQAARERATLWA